MPARSRGRSGRAWVKVGQRVYAEETHCWLCHRWVDQSLPPRTPASRSVDHIVPLSLGGDPLDRANLRLAHHGCNSRRGANAPHAPLRGASRAW
jgi:5-methylcytosine-specific restriction endonuclease McrA